MRVRIKKIVSWIGIIYACCILMLLVYQQYFSADARYASDNLSYVISRTTTSSATKIQKNIKLQPMVVKLSILDQIAEYQTAQYLHEFNTVSKNQSWALPEEPYDIFARLWLQANDADVQTIYNGIQFMAAVTNPKHPETTSQILLQSQNGQTSAFSEYLGASDLAVSNLYNDYKNLLTLHITILVIILLDKLVVYIKHKKRK